MVFPPSLGGLTLPAMMAASAMEKKYANAPPSRNRNFVMLLQNIVFGGTAGVVGQGCVFPLYTAKTNLQQFPNRYSSLLDCFRQIARRDGLRALYTGLRPTLTFTFPEKAIKLAMNDYLRASFADKQGQVSILRGVAAGAGAGVCQVIVTNPMEMLMITMQTREAQGMKPVGMAKLGRELGFRRLYRDIPATLLRDIPFSMVFFPMHTSLSEAFANENGQTPVSKVLLSGLICGSTAAALSTPADVVKTRVMASTGAAVHTTKGAAEVAVPQYQRIVHCFQDVVKTEGIRGLCKGMVPRVLIISPLFGITTMFYEALKNLRERGIM